MGVPTFREKFKRWADSTYVLSMRMAYLVCHVNKKEWVGRIQVLFPLTLTLTLNPNPDPNTNPKSKPKPKF